MVQRWISASLRHSHYIHSLHTYYIVNLYQSFRYSPCSVLAFLCKNILTWLHFVVFIVALLASKSAICQTWLDKIKYLDHKFHDHESIFLRGWIGFEIKYWTDTKLIYTICTRPLDSIFQQRMIGTLQC